MDTQMSPVSRVLVPVWTGVVLGAVILVGGLCVGHSGETAEEALKTAGERSAVIADVPAPGGPARRIAEGFAPAWSPDAKTLYFLSAKDRKLTSIEIKADGSPGATKDHFSVALESLVAAISPDGRRVAHPRAWS